MNPRHPVVILLAAGALLAGSGLACGAGGSNGTAVQNGAPTGNQGSAPLDLAAYPYQPPDTTERADLEAMRQEEKLARDVYRHFARRYATPVFGAIARSEQTHTDRVADLLAKYGLADPAADDAEGLFRDRRFSDLYVALTARGDASQAEAVQVGLDIENLDIDDLDAALARTDNEDIARVYGALRAGSENHQRAFTNLAP